MMHTTFKVLETCLWYLDSGYSRHMTRGRFLFKTFEPKRGDNVTFGDGSKSQIKENELSPCQDNLTLRMFYMSKG